MLVKACSWAPIPWMLPESELSAEGQGETYKEHLAQRPPRLECLMKARRQPQASLLKSDPFYLLRQGVTLTRNMPTRTTWLASKPQGPCCLCVPIAEVTSICATRLCFLKKYNF